MRAASGVFLEQCDGRICLFDKLSFLQLSNQLSSLYFELLPFLRILQLFELLRGLPQRHLLPLLQAQVHL